MSMSRILLAALATACLLAVNPAAQTRSSKSLQIYVVDVEGGNATLIVPPSGESLLIDTGNPSNGRDAARIIAAAADAGVWAAVAWQAVGNALFGYAAWGWLLARHPAATVAPMALLVPVFGMSASALLLAEGLPAWKLVAAALVLAGLALNLLGSRLLPRS